MYVWYIIDTWMQEEVIYIELDGVNDIIIRKWKDMKKIMPLAFVIIVFLYF